MFNVGAGFAVCRHLGERHAVADEQAKVVIVDGPNALGVLEEESFRTAETPAIVLLTPDEWLSGQPDSNRIVNALGDWGCQCEDWPDPEIAIPGLGGLNFRLG
ncbi:hypothetical protein GCM10028862_03170 [Luteimonas pelagia]